MRRRSARRFRDQARMAMPATSPPSSETHVPGRPRFERSASSSRTTRRPEIEASGARARRSRAKSSATARMRNRPPSAKASDTKSGDPAARQAIASRRREGLGSGAAGTSIGRRVPSARSRPLRRFAWSFSPAWIRRGFSRFALTPSRPGMTRMRRLSAIARDRLSAGGWPKRRRSPAIRRMRSRRSASSARRLAHRSDERSIRRISQAPSRRMHAFACRQRTPARSVRRARMSRRHSPGDGPRRLPSCDVLQNGIVEHRLGETAFDAWRSRPRAP